MAAYAATITSLMTKAVKIDSVVGIGIFAGRCDLTNYNTTAAEITAITGKFKSLIAVKADGLSDNGYLVFWHPTDKAFHAHYPTNASDQTPTADIAAAAAAEVANDVDIGAFDFIAIGFL